VQGGPVFRIRSRKGRQVKLVFTSLTRQLRVNSSVDTFKGKSQRIHASRFTLHASSFTNCCVPTTRTFAAPQAQSSQTSPTQGITRHGMSLCYTAVLLHCYQHSIRRVRGSPPSSTGQFSFPEHDICKRAAFQISRRYPCYRPPQYYKRLSITVRIGWQRPIEPVAPKPSPQGPVLPYHHSIKTSTSALKFSTPEVPSCRRYMITCF
jgi:hypothetical protein